ncbi:MAG: hypothetical protein PVF65_09880 [Sphingomonadales bacterium]|jgi:hypothetical protein
MRLIDRIMLAVLALGIWSLVFVELTSQPANAVYDLSRQDVAAAMREVLRQNKPLTAQELQSLLSQTLSRCQISGQLNDENTAEGDRVDFRARISC